MALRRSSVKPSYCHCNTIRGMFSICGGNRHTQCNHQTIHNQPNVGKYWPQQLVLSNFESLNTCSRLSKDNIIMWSCCTSFGTWVYISDPSGDNAMRPCCSILQLLSVRTVKTKQIKGILFILAATIWIRRCNDTHSLFSLVFVAVYACTRKGIHYDLNDKTGNSNTKAQLLRGEQLGEA